VSRKLYSRITIIITIFCMRNFCSAKVGVGVGVEFNAPLDTV